MREEFQPAIAALQKDLVNLERKSVETKKAINVLCKLADVASMYPVVEDGPSAVLTLIQADTFYGKRMSTAAREYLQMRKGGGQGPAKPRDVYEALKDGGFQFDTKDEQTALVSLRATMRKNSSIFHRLPNGQYGLTAWYPNVRRPKAVVEENDAAEEVSPEDRDEDNGHLESAGNDTGTAGVDAEQHDEDSVGEIYEVKAADEGSVQSSAA